MWIWLSVVCVAASLCLLMAWFARPLARSSRPQAPTRHLVIRLAWPWVEALAPLCQAGMSWHMRRKLGLRLQQAGLATDWSPAQFRAWQCVLALLFGGVAGYMLWRILSPGPWVVGVLAVAGVAAIFPELGVRERIQARQRSMLREFPFMLDMVTLCVEAGLNLQGALRQAAAHGPEGPLRDELRHMLSDVRAGLPRQAALEQWATRCGLSVLNQFVAAVAQAEVSGMSLAAVLRSQADQRRSERFHRAEKLALEAPVKMIFPLVFCIFPCTFLVLAFPVAGRFLALMH